MTAIFGIPEWIVGVVLSLIGSVGNNLGNNLVSLGHIKEREKSSGDLLKSSKTLSNETASEAENENNDKEGALDSKGDNKEEEKDWRVIGTVVFVVGNLLNFVAFGFGAQSLIASLDSVQFVCNVVFAKYVHHEAITKRMLVSTGAILAGNVLVIVFSSHESPRMDSRDMIYLYRTNTAYHVYLVFAFLLWLSTSFIFRKYHHSRTVLRAPLLYNHNFIEPFCYAVSSAIIGTQAVLNSKCMSILIQVSVRGERNEFGFWYIYFVLITWLMLVVYWLKRLDWGLELFPPLFIIPVMQVFFVLFAILCGGIYFKEFSTFSIYGYVGFVAGVIAILIGVYGLAPKDMELYIPELGPGEANDEDEDEDELAEKLEKGDGTTAIRTPSKKRDGSSGGGTGPPGDAAPAPKLSSSKKNRYESHTVNSFALESKIAKSLPFFDDYFMEVNASPRSARSDRSHNHSPRRTGVRPKPKQIDLPVLSLPPTGGGRNKVYLEPLPMPSLAAIEQGQASPGVTSGRKSARRVVINRNSNTTTPRGSELGPPDERLHFPATVTATDLYGGGILGSSGGGRGNSGGGGGGGVGSSGTLLGSVDMSVLSSSPTRPNSSSSASEIDAVGINGGIASKSQSPP